MCIWEGRSKPWSKEVLSPNHFMSSAHTGCATRPHSSEPGKTKPVKTIGGCTGISPRSNGPEGLHYPLVTEVENCVISDLSALHNIGDLLHFSLSALLKQTARHSHNAMMKLGPDWDTEEMDVSSWTVGCCSLQGHCTVRAAGMSLFLLTQWICARQSDAWSGPFPQKHYRAIMFRFYSWPLLLPEGCHLFQ